MIKGPVGLPVGDGVGYSKDHVGTPPVIRGLGVLVLASLMWNAAGCSATPVASTPTMPAPAVIPTKILAQLGMIAFVVLEGHPPSSIYKMVGDGTWVTALTKDYGGNGNPAWSRDGQRIAFVSWRDGTPALYVMGQDGGNVYRLPAANVIDGKLAWSPDGRQIGFTGVTGETKSDVWVINLGDSKVENLTKDRGEDQDPAWSPGGSQIAFASNRSGKFQVYVMNKDGSRVEQLTSDPQGCHEPDWSPDGRRIAFACYSGHGDVIHTMNADGSHDVSLMDSEGVPGGSHPSWSPDGQRIAFQSARLGLNDIYVMDADGSNITRLTTLEPFGMQAIEPSWQPTVR